MLPTIYEGSEEQPEQNTSIEEEQPLTLLSVQQPMWKAPPQSPPPCNQPANGDQGNNQSAEGNKPGLTTATPTEQGNQAPTDPVTAAAAQVPQIVPAAKAQEPPRWLPSQKAPPTPAWDQVPWTCRNCNARYLLPITQTSTVILCTALCCENEALIRA